MNPLLENWLACPTCGGELVEGEGGLRSPECSAVYEVAEHWIDLVDTRQKVSSEGPGDTLAMAWRRRRWDELRGPSAPENADYLAAIWERLRPDDRVLDLGCGPASFLAWMADFASELAILGLDLSAAALEEATRAVGRRTNIALVRASARRRLPVRDGSCDVVLRRLAPGLPEEIARALAPGGHYLRFTFAPGHWREVYDLMPGLPRAREDTLAGEAERLRALGLEVEEPIRHEGSEEFTVAAVMLALRSNPAAFHADKVDFRPMRSLWHDDEGGGRRATARLSTEYAILVARKPAAAAVVTVEKPADEEPKPKRRTPKKTEPAEEPAASVEAAAGPLPADDEAAPPSKPARARRAKTKADTPNEPASTVAAETPAETQPPGDEPAEPAKPKRARRGSAAAAETTAAASTEAAPPEPATELEPPPAKRAPARRKKAEPAPDAPVAGGDEPSSPAEEPAPEAQPPTDSEPD